LKEVQTQQVKRKEKVQLDKKFLYTVWFFHFHTNASTPLCLLKTLALNAKFEILVAWFVPLYCLLIDVIITSMQQDEQTIHTRPSTTTMILVVRTKTRTYILHPTIKCLGKCNIALHCPNKKNMDLKDRGFLYKVMLH